MTKWSRSLFGISLVFGVGAMLLAERLPQWWGPASLIFVVLAAAVFVTCSVLEYRRGGTLAGTAEQPLSL